MKLDEFSISMKVDYDEQPLNDTTPGEGVVIRPVHPISVNIMKVRAGTKFRFFSETKLEAHLRQKNGGYHLHYTNLITKRPKNIYL